MCMHMCLHALYNAPNDVMSPSNWRLMFLIVNLMSGHSATMWEQTVTNPCRWYNWGVGVGPGEKNKHVWSVGAKREREAL